MKLQGFVFIVIGYGLVLVEGAGDSRWGVGLSFLPLKGLGGYHQLELRIKEEEQLSRDTNHEFVSLWTHFLNILNLHLAKVSVTSLLCVRSSQAIVTLETQDCKNYCMYWAFILETWI